MIDALRVAWQSLKDLWDEMVFLIVLNVAWSLLSLLAAIPLLLLFESDPVVGLASSIVLFWLLSIVTGALCFVANQITRGYAVGWGTFAHGLKRYWLKSLVAAIINIIMLALIAFNVLFYALQIQGAWTYFAVSIWGAIGIYWLLVQVYWFPMLLEMKSEKIFASLRNALALPFITPGFSTTILLVLVLLVVLSTFLMVPLVLFMVVLLLLITNHATRNRLEMIRQKHEARQGAGAGAE
jgi:uncharacterized membrane protein YesL